MKKTLFLLICCLTTVSYSQTVRKYSNEFMNIGVDAAALGMSNAVVSHTQDVNSGYWNPAGLMHIKDKQFAFMHANYFANIAQYDYAGFAMPIDDRSAVGIFSTSSEYRCCLVCLPLLKWTRRTSTPLLSPKL